MNAFSWLTVSYMYEYLAEAEDTGIPAVTDLEAYVTPPWFLPRAPQPVTFQYSQIAVHLTWTPIHSTPFIRWTSRDALDAIAHTLRSVRIPRS